LGVFQNPTSGEISNITDVTLFASAARTATANGTAVALGDLGTLRLFLDVTAASGTTPTLDVTVETSYDGSTGWRAISASGSAFTQATGVTSQRRSFVGCDRYVRAVATIGGTSPSFTFSLSGEAV
jgi:hypothetical protein